MSRQRTRARSRTTSLSSSPPHDVLEPLAIEVAAAVVTEKLHAPVEVHVRLARDVRRDEHARVVPQATVGVAFEFPAIDVERGPTDLAIGQPLLQRGLVDGLAPGHV